MQKILSFFRKEYVNVNQAALLLGSFALISQILGLFRDRLIAHSIGPSPLLDAYYTAFRIPDLIFISIASLASITVLIPFIYEKMDGDKVSEKAKKFLNDIFTVFFAVIISVSVLVFILMPYLVVYIAPGFTFEMQEKVIELSRIMLLSPIFLGLSNLFGSITQLFRKFFVYALSPIFYNLSIITGVLFFYPVFGIHGLAYGIVLGAFIHFVIQAVSSLYSGFAPRFSFDINFTDIKKVVLVSLPRTLGLSCNNIALILIISFATYLTSGSISIFNLSLNLQSVPLGIIGLSYAVAAFPMLTKFYTSGKIDEFKNHLTVASRAIIFWSLPVTFLFIVLRAQIVRVILGSGSFSWENTRLVAASLAIFSLSIMAQGLIALFARAYYAVGNTRRPLIINFVSSVSIVFFSFFFLYIFKNMPQFKYFIESILKVADIKGTEVLMLPLAYSFGTIINFILLYISLKIDFMKEQQFISKTFFQSLSASFFIGTVSYVSLNIFSPIFGTVTFWGVFLQGLISGIIGILVGMLVLYLLGSTELKDLIHTLKTKFWRARIVAPPQEGL
ncbi:MAG: Integral membrane protein MviN [Candidatus Nomurabacteria bacterium GW2011_GWA2_40_9]|uniref:Probable lipid II flippase MurJ n=1 Tax=Candidatus Nomurabacteria bacterium GW2011_GWA2_40_9 TaxID=1618734 RepID=A0A0G0W6E4_9BACT|nr:MAG: Integral membrane protein MviN [Candidatus Nomurabacteria bacterium GW2011_GWA2_40_9]